MTGGWIWVTCRAPNTLQESDVGAMHAKYAGWFKYLFLHTRRNSKCHCMMAAQLGHGEEEGGAGLSRGSSVMMQPHGMETRGWAQICPNNGIVNVMALIRTCLMLITHVTLTVAVPGVLDTQFGRPTSHQQKFKSSLSIIFTKWTKIRKCLKSFLGFLRRGFTSLLEE